MYEHSTLFFHVSQIRRVHSEEALLLMPGHSLFLWRTKPWANQWKPWATTNVCRWGKGCIQNADCNGFMRIGLSIRKWRPEKDLIKGVEHYSFLFVMGCLQVPALSSIKGMWCAENLWFRTTVWFMMILQRAAASSVTRYFQIYWFFIRTAFWKKFYVIHTICFLEFEEFLSNCPCLFLFCDRCNILSIY